MTGKRGKRVVIVLGMHRSGTSAITRGLQVLGVGLGANLMGPMKDVNDKGFWEDLDISVLNNELLAALGSNWHYLAPINSSDLENLGRTGYFDKAGRLLSQKMETVDIFGFKDPRLAKLLPFWRETFNTSQLDTSCVLAFRHPLSVARSLAKRDGFDVEKSYFLWLGHVLASLWGSAGLKRVLVDYDRLIRSPKNEIRRIADRLGLEIDPVELQNYESDFLDISLRHTVYELNDLAMDSACPPLVKEIYTTLLDVASGATDLDDPDFQLLIEHWGDEYKHLEPALSLVDKFSERNAISSQAIIERDHQITRLNKATVDRATDIANLKDVIALQDQKIACLHDQIESLYSSISWRLTRPIRAFKSAVPFFPRPKNRVD